MTSAIKIKQNELQFDYLYYQVEFRKNNHLRCFSINSLDQVFMGEKISFQKAINKKSMLQCFIEFGGDYKGEFLTAGSVSLTWEPNENAIYVGLLWIEPSFRGNELSTYILNEIINFADELGIILTLYAIPFISLKMKPTDKDISELKKYYNRFGFRNSSKARKLGFHCSMERIPKTKASV